VVGGITFAVIDALFNDDCRLDDRHRREMFRVSYRHIDFENAVRPVSHLASLRPQRHDMPHENDRDRPIICR
jgi:hypothetical protein